MDAQAVRCFAFDNIYNYIAGKRYGLECNIDKCLKDSNLLYFCIQGCDVDMSCFNIPDVCDPTEISFGGISYMTIDDDYNDAPFTTHQ